MFGRLTPVTKNLLIINIAIYALESFFNLNLSNFLGLRYILADTFIPIQFITYMFLHGSWMHVLSNMFALFIFGPLLEQFWGGKRFLIFYMVTGIGAGILYSGIDFFETRSIQVAMEGYTLNPSADKFSSYIAKNGTIARIDGQLMDVSGGAYRIEDRLYEQPDNTEVINQSKKIVIGVYDFISNVPMVGASGAVFGILMAFGLLFPNTTLMLLFPPIPIKAKYFVAIYGFIELFAGIQRAPGDNVAHFAHLGGMLVAFILLKIWQSDRKKFF
jgi:membrane associated rhomboid family serine protease